MLLPIPSSRQNIKPYHRNQQVLVQFILAEFILVFEELHSIDSLIEAPDCASEEKNFISLAKHLNALTGSSLQYARLFSCYQEGFLERLQNYTALFCHATGHVDEKRNEMHRSIKLSLIYSLEALEIMKYLPKDCTVEDMGKLIPAIKKMKKTLVKTARLLSDVMPQFRYNENVLFFLLNHHIGLDKIYKDSFVKKTMCRFFSKSLEKAEDYIISKYKARGFAHLIPLIQHGILTIQNTSTAKTLRAPYVN